MEQHFDLNCFSFNFGFKGIDYNSAYNHDVTPVFNGVATLNGNNFVSGTAISEEGSHSLVITEPNGEHTTVPFNIDKTSPVVSGVENNGIYNRPVTINFDESPAILNGTSFNNFRIPPFNPSISTGYQVRFDGKYNLIIYDIAGNKTDLTFIVDQIKPVITFNSVNTKPTSKNVPIHVNASNTGAGLSSFTDPDGHIIEGNSGVYYVTKNGTYKFSVIDKAGNVSTKQIIINNIDKDNPGIDLSPSTTKITNKNIYIKVKGTDKDSGVYSNTLPNGNTVISSKIAYQITKNGTYSFTIKDKAGNIVSRKIVVKNIDKIAPGKPSVNKLTSKSKSVDGKAEKNSTVYVYRGSSYLGKSSVNSNGTYSVKISKQKKKVTLTIFAKDKAGNKSKLTKVVIK